MDDFVAGELGVYRTREERVAYRAALGTAAGICDRIARRTKEANTTRGRVTQAGEALADVAKRCGDELWAIREQVRLSDADDPVTEPSEPASSAVK